MRRWGWNGTSYQILNPGFCFWIDRAHDAAVGYVECHGVRVVGGAPVCAADRFEAVVHAFERDAANAGHGVIYFGAEFRIAELARGDDRRTTFSIGSQPVWSPDVLLHEFAIHASLRAQLNRARNKHLSAHLLSSFDAATSESLHRCLGEWIDSRGLPPLHFLIETQTLDDLADRRIFVAERDGAVVAFLVATPIPARNGWLIEQIVRGAGARNGTAELLLHEAARVLGAEGASMLTLGLAPLARKADAPVHQAPRWLDGMLAALRSHGRHFYNFEGLEAFKSKFGGARWDPVYASLAPGTHLVRALLAVTAAFSGERLLTFGPHVLARGLVREAKRLTGLPLRFS